MGRTGLLLREEYAILRMKKSRFVQLLLSSSFLYLIKLLGFKMLKREQLLTISLGRR